MLRVVGLSPLARGTLSAVLLTLHSSRFIPAGAGNTWRRRRPLQIAPVYPRWRGEHVCDVVFYANVFGLSPLARGTLLLCAHPRFIRRFIPAGAGNTPSVCTAG
ncbi:hypothetical protein SED60170_25140 [Salmonella enterica subsp. diarizonae serovar 60:r:e,n,x,z15 str. 01-0170]|nr:hypothetical protein SED60170_25140 [Salmonella enterica subsp. diarizonae serovar 60:r:e,n,x,z15 str. 01-0170]